MEVERKEFAAGRLPGSLCNQGYRAQLAFGPVADALPMLARVVTSESCILLRQIWMIKSGYAR
jgi:hypothetical protein